MNFDYVPKIGKIEIVPAIVGMRSLVGVGKDRPVRFGNYFSLWDEEEKDTFQHIRVLNFWAENLQYAVSTGLLQDRKVKIVLYPKQQAIIFDERIPESWYYNKLCFTGSYMPEKEVAREIYDIVGDPNNEYEQFEDPKSYYEKRGMYYDAENGIVRVKIGASK